MKGKGFLQLAAALLVIAAAVYFAIAGIGADKIGSASDIKLGLDLAGGVSITYETVIEDPTDSELSDTVYKMQRRAESFSNEAEVYPEGDRRITVAIPDVTDADAVLEQLGDAGNIYFIYGCDANGVEYIERQTGPETEKDEYKLRYSMEEIISMGGVVLDGSDIAGAEANMYKDEMNVTQSVVVLNLNENGRAKFAEATAYAYKYYTNGYDTDLRNLIAIVYDNEIISAPCVADVITGGEATITMESSSKSVSERYEEAKILASTIRIGALPLELSVLRYYVEGAKLGADALDSSLIAGLIGFVIIVIFMIAVYRIPGLAASIALVFYVALMVFCLNIFNVTLTLPGIAGIILSIGMAVDANVIIFTRIQEELTVGKTVRSSIKLGFGKALSAIIDGNITTIIAAIVLYLLGSGTVKGFAQTLAIGIVLSMLTALFVSKFILNALFKLGANKVKHYGLKKEKGKIRFVENFRKFVTGSVIVIVIGIGAIIVNLSSTGAPFNYGLEFVGGTATTVTFDGELPQDAQAELDKLVRDSIGMGAEISIVRDSSMVTIRTKELSTGDRAKLAKALADRYGIDEELITTNSVGSTVSSEMKQDAVVAVAVSAVMMLIYIWFRFKNVSFAISSVVPLIHDVLIVLTVYAVGSSFISVGNSFIACLLTIVGYSINATIVVFDRIRENRTEKFGKLSTLEVVNLSVNQTLSRSINTSLTTFFMVLLLAILGVSSVREFAIPLIAGILAGGFSSVCIAGGLWYHIQNKLKKEE